MKEKKYSADYWIDKLALEKHPEGGWFKEVYRADESVKKEHLHLRYSGDRQHSTSIYFLLTSDTFSAFHRIKSDELWHFYTGSAVTIHMIDEAGKYSKITLGGDADAGEVFQCFIPKHVWFGANVVDTESYSLVGCTVSPGFHFDDFKLGKRDELVRQFPQHKEMIERLTRI